MRTWRRCSVAAFGLLLAMGCASGLPSQEHVDDALLTPEEDLPDGWETRGREETAEAEMLGGQCQLQEKLDDANPDVQARQVYGQSSEDQLATIQQVILGYDERAGPVFDELPDLIEDCESDTDLFDEFRVSEVDFRELGQDSQAWRLRRQGSVAGNTVGMDSVTVVWLDDHLIQSLTHTRMLGLNGQQPDARPLEFLEEVAEAATERMP